MAPDHPTEFSAAVGRRVGAGSPLGPYFLHRAEDDVVVGEIGGAFVTPGEIELGYAIVPSCWGQGDATEAVLGLVARAREVPGVERTRPDNLLNRSPSPQAAHLARAQPPAMAGRITSVSDSDTEVWSPSRTRTSSSLRYTLT